MSGLKDFIEDLQLIEKYSEKITVQAIFIAGMCTSKSGAPTESILKCLAYAEKLSESKVLSNTNKTIIEFHFYKGEIAEGRKLLKEYKLKSSMDITEIRSENISTQPVKTAMAIDSKPKGPENVSIQAKVQETVKKPQIAQNDKKPQINSENNTKIFKPTTARKSKLTSEVAHKYEIDLLDTLNNLRRIDEKESLRLRKLEEEKRLQAEIQAKQEKERLEKEYEEKLRKELEERKRKEEQAMKCVVCKDIIKDNELTLLETCMHSFHKKCFKETILKEFEAKKVPLSCISCKTELQIPEIKICLTMRQYKQYEEMTFQNFMNVNSDEFNSCPTLGCSYLFEFDPNMQQFDCPSCRKNYCLNCRSLAHLGWNCGAMLFGNRGLVQGVLRGQKLKQCIMCNLWMEKPADSATLRCRCGNHFCYNCGKLKNQCIC